MSRNSPGQQKEPGSGEGGRPGSDQMPPPVDVDAIARGFGPQGPILLNKMVHGLFDAFIPIFLLCPPRARRQQFRLRFNLPHRGQRGITPALRLFTLETKGRGRSGTKAGQPDRTGASWVRSRASSGARSWGPGASVRHGVGQPENEGTAEMPGLRHGEWCRATGRHIWDKERGLRRLVGTPVGPGASPSQSSYCCP